MKETMSQYSGKSHPQEQQEIQRSLSLIWNVSPNIRKTHHEIAESLGQQGNNAEFKELLKQMREEMQERDKKLTLQLQMRDKYLDKELRKRDQY